MRVAEDIEKKLMDALSPVSTSVENESHQHGGTGTETHFKLTVVADSFAALRAVQRHQKVYQILSEELANGVHALAMHLYTVDEWEHGQSVPQSPNCLGGSK